MSNSSYHIFTRLGDARSEVESVLRELGVSPEDAGFHKAIHVSRANQTVVFLTGRESLLANTLRKRKGWNEPEQ